MPRPPRDPSADALEAYRRKRAVDRTPEPAGTVAATPGTVFVVQKHDATRLHYDLRLELDGVLKSWAVPKGPSRNTADKRVAIHVEDHPVEYADFEGVIPEGNYGAGAVIVWDRGTYVALEDMHAGFEKGKLLFELRGYKLRGRWTLVKIKKAETEWLLIKERDEWVSEDGDAFPQGSVLSGLTVEELAGGGERAGEVRNELERLKAVRRPLHAADVKLMLAESREGPFSGEEWVFELKYDGYRMLAESREGAGRLVTRSGRDATGSFPDIVRALRALPYAHLVIDGEVVVHDEAGLPSFQRLQKRAMLSRSTDIRRAAVALPATLYVFDLLGFEDFDLRSLPLVERKALLRRLLPEAGPLRYADHIEGRGEAFYEGVERMGLEGMVAKKAAGPYRAGRSADWLKVRASPTDDFVIVGHTSPKGSRTGFGALHLATHIDGVLTFTGTVGTGFTERLLRDTSERLDESRRVDAPCAGPPAGSDHHWVEPELVCEVRYVEVTGEGLLRQPVFLRFRDDKPPAECVRTTRLSSSGSDDPSPSAEGPGATPQDETEADREEAFPEVRVSESREVRFTNLDKVLWPQDGYTKGDLIEYYRAIAPWMLPYLRDRPVVLTRFPDGIDGKSFFQKDAPSFAPDWIRTETVYSGGSERDLSYFVCDDEATLLYLANSASIPLHVWASRIASLATPDWCILDLDPKEAPFTDVVRVARHLHELSTAIGLPAYIKTSGSSGLHVMVPLGRQLTHEQARSLGELLARVVAKELPEIATIVRLPAKREGKVYVDFMQNGHGKLLVAPFCVRPLPGAPVSTPLEWSEVEPGLDIRAFTIRNVPARLETAGRDPLRAVLEEKPDLVGALAALHPRL
jgi:bifunctional non-homologous end joining protein LigD